jgi:hypothetical protein
MLREELGGIAPDDYKYWDVVSSAALVRARSFGAVSGMEEAGVTEYKILAMGDERMCPICGEMNGRAFSVAGTRKVINSALSLTDPEAFKKAMPWQAKPAAGVSSSKLCAGGQSVPPFHGRCRCVLVAADEAETSDAPRRKAKGLEHEVAAAHGREAVPEAEREKKIKQLIAAGINTDQDAIAIGDLLYSHMLNIVDSNNVSKLPDLLAGEIEKYRDLGGSLHFVKGSHDKAKASIAEATKLYPTDWLNEISKNGGVLAKAAARGMHIYSNGHHEIAIDAAKSTAIHELGHAFERYFGSLSIEKQTYDRRTKGEALEQLSKIYPSDGYKDYEMTRKDKFAHAYMGKDYGGKSYELYSTSLQGVYFNELDMWHKDPESIKLMIGVLLGVR